MRVVVSGGHGRLGRLMVPWLESRGLDVYAPTRAELDWTSPTGVYQVIRDSDRVLALASWTDVAGAQRDPDGCVRDTVQTVQATLRAATRTNTQIRYLGTDYTLSRGGDMVLDGTQRQVRSRETGPPQWTLGIFIPTQDRSRDGDGWTGLQVHPVLGGGSPAPGWYLGPHGPGPIHGPSGWVASRHPGRPTAREVPRPPCSHGRCDGPGGTGETGRRYRPPDTSW